MEQQAVDAAALGAHGAGELTLIGLFWAADWVVKAVMIGLLAASIWTWAIVFEKIRRFRRLRKRGNQFEERFWSGISLDSLYDEVSDNPPDPLAATFAAGMDEWRHAVRHELLGTEALRAGVRERIDRAMQVTVNREMDRLERSMVVLATIGSSAPFIGLFGTVWGIMNSFTSIAASRSTNLAVVAPGIAEALFATALGLVAAIPAVIAYNKFNDDLGRYGDRLDQFSTEFRGLLTRYMQERVRA